MSNVDFHRIFLTRDHMTNLLEQSTPKPSSICLTRSYSFMIHSFAPLVSNVFHQSMQQIRSICNQHDELSSIKTDVEPVASISRSLEIPTQMSRSISMPDTTKISSE